MSCCVHYSSQWTQVDAPAQSDQEGAEPTLTLSELGARCGYGFRSLDAANLYFPGVGLDRIGAAPWAYAPMARTIMSHINGTARLEMEPLPHRLNHFDLVNYLAPRDPGSFVPGEWEEQFRKIAMGTGDEVAYPRP